MMKKNLFKKIATGVFSAVFALSTVMSALPAFAGSGDKTDSTEITFDNETTLSAAYGSENAISGKMPYLAAYYKSGQDPKDFVSNTMLGNLTDGKADTEYRASLDAWFAKVNDDNTVTYYQDGKEVYMDLAYDLGGVRDVTGVLVLNHSDTKLRTNSYKVYVSNSKDDLYTDANLIADVDNTSKNARRQVISTKPDSTLSARYVGIRVIDPTHTHLDSDLTNPLKTAPVNQCYLRLYELSIFAKKDTASRATVESDDKRELLSFSEDSGIENLIKGKLAKYCSNKGSGDVAAKQDLDLLDRLTDEVVNASSEFMGRDIRFFEDKDGQVTYKREIWSASLTYDLGAKSDLSKMVVVNHLSEPTLRTGHYAIYASDTEETLYDDESLVLDFKNTNQKTRQVLSFENISARFVGLRVLDPISDYTSGPGATPTNAYVRLFELAVYGTKAPEAKFSTTADDKTECDTSLGKENIIKGLQPSSVVYYSNFGNDKTNANNSNITLLTDGDPASDGWRSSTSFFAEYDKNTEKSSYIGDGIDEGKYYLDMTFDFGKAKSVTGFEVFNHASKELRTYHYEVYLSNDPEKLFNAESKIAEFVNKNGNRRNAFKKETSDDVKGRYFGLRISDPTFGKGTGMALAYIPQDQNNYVYPRINELAVYGEGAGLSDKVIMDDTMAMPDIADDLISKGIQTEEKFWNGNTYETCAVMAHETLTDGLYTGDYRTSNTKFAKFENGTAQYIGQGIKEGSIYEDITLNLGGNAKVTALALLNHVDKNLRTKHYKIYFTNASTPTDLFNDSNLFYDVQNEDGAFRNIFDVTALNGGSPKEARYVGIRVFDPTYTKGTGVTEVTENSNNIYVRLNELAVYGEVTGGSGDKNIVFDNQCILPDYGKNMLQGLLPAAYFTMSGKRSVVLGVDVANITDGNARSEGRYNYRFAEVNKFGNVIDHTTNGDGDAYLDLIYDMYSDVNIDGLALIHHSTEALRTTRYQIYAASKYEDLFKEENLVYDVENKGFQRNAWNLKELGKKTVGRFVAIRVLNPTAPVNSSDAVSVKDNNNNIYTRLYEIAVYGAYVDPNFVYKETFTPIKNSPDASLFNKTYGKNLLNGRTATEASVSGQPVSLYTQKATSGLLTDGDPATGYDFKNPGFTTSDGSNYLDLMWNLNDDGETVYEFTNFIYLGLNNSLSAYYTGWWQLYISEDYDNLFDSDSMAFEYNAIREETPDVNCRGQIIKFDKPIRGSYVGVRVLAPVYTATSSIYPRIYELGIYGTKTDVDKTPSNIAVNMPVEAYTEDTAGALKQISESDFTVKEAKNLTDGNAATTATVTAGGKKVHFLYNLCQDIDVSGIYVTGADGSLIKNYKIYAASDLGSVWDSGSLQYTYNNSNPQKRTGKAFSKSKNFRYVRIEILDKTDNVSLAEVEVLAPKYKMLKSKNMVRPLSNSAFRFFTQNMKTGKINYFSPEKTSILHDNTKAMAAGIYAGKPGEDSVNIVIDLGDCKTVNQFNLYFATRAWDYMPKKTRIYFGLDVESLESVSAKPDYEFNGLPTNSAIKKALMPRLSRYVRISFLDGGITAAFDEMCYAMSEIQVYGTPVVGMNTPNTNVLDFEDKSLGVKWGVVRSNTNDIFTGVASSTVTVSKVTNWQKKSLQKTPYMKIVGAKKYTFKFYDITGKEVTDFGSRSLEFSFKYRDGMDEGTSMAGYAGNKWYIQPYDSSTEVSGYVTCYESERTTGLTYSMMKLITSTDPYWSKIGPLEDYGDEEPEYAPTTALDSSTSTAEIITEDGDFSIKPRGALRLPIDSQLYVTVRTFNTTSTVYDAISSITDIDNLAASYILSLRKEDEEFIFDGKVKAKIHIPDIIDGYFDDYKLAKITADGTAEYVDFERNGDYILFNTSSLGEYALVGSGYHPNGDGNGGNGGSVDGNPATGEQSTPFFLVLAVMSLAGIVVLNFKKIRSK